MRKQLLTRVPMLLSAGLLFAQAPDQSQMGSQHHQMQQGLPSNNQVQPVQEAVPFGVVSGRLVTSGHNMIFIDDQQPQNSFVIRRNDIRDVHFDGSTVTMNLTHPVRDSSGQRSTVSFRFQNPAAATTVTSWAGQGTHGAQAAAPPPQSVRAEYSAQSAPQAVPMDGATRPQQPISTPPGSRSQVFDVRRNRALWRSDTGRLFVTPTEVIYQSLSNPGASRRWAMTAIREVDRRNPFELRVRPYAGSDYNFRIIGGSGMSTPQFMALTNNVNRAHMQSNYGYTVQTDGVSAAGGPGQ